MKEVILTGIRSNEEPTLGNYLGAFVPMVQMQQKFAGKYQVNMFVPDLHSFTTPIDHSQLRQQIMHNLKLFVAAGLPQQHSLGREHELLGHDKDDKTARLTKAGGLLLQGSRFTRQGRPDDKL